MPAPLPELGVRHLPPEDFDKVHWLLPLRGSVPCPTMYPAWHYWSPRSVPHPGGAVNLATVDPLLQSMVHYAQAVRIRTLPSCEGHFEASVDLDKVWEGLLDDEPRIRRGELSFVDVETGEIRRPRLPDWKLPDPASIRDRSPGVGRIGFVFDESRQALYFRWRVQRFTESHLRITEQGKGAVIVVVRGTDPDNLRWHWRGVESALRGVPVDPSLPRPGHLPGAP